MTKYQDRKGPGQGIFNIIHRIGYLLMDAAQSRVKLATLELEEQRTLFFQLFIAAGLALLFVMFALMTLLVLLCWVIPSDYRLIALVITIVLLFILSITCIIFVIKKTKNTPFLPETRRQLYLDSQSLKNIADD